MTDYRMRRRPLGGPLDLTQGLSVIGDALDGAAEAKRKKADAAEYARQNDLAEKRFTAQEARAAQTQADADVDRKAKIRSEIAAKVDAGDVAGARLLAATYGVPFDAGDGPPGPEGPPGPAPSASAPRPYGDTARILNPGQSGAPPPGFRKGPGEPPVERIPLPERSDAERMQALEEAKARGVEILPPDDSQRDGAYVYLGQGKGHAYRAPAGASAAPPPPAPAPPKQGGEFSGFTTMMGKRRPQLDGVQLGPNAEERAATKAEAEAKRLEAAGYPEEAALVRSQISGATAQAIRNRALQEDSQQHQEKMQGDRLTSSQKVAATRRRAAGTSTKADDDDVFDPDTGGKLFDAPTPQQAKELNENGRIMARVRAESQELKAEYAKLPTGLAASLKQGNPIGNFFLSEEEKTALQNVNRLKTSITGQMSQMKGMGAPSTTELTEVQKGIVRGRSQSQESYGQSADDAVKSLEKSWRSGLPAHGFKGDKPAATSPDRARYEQAIAKARAAGKMDLVKRLQAEMGGQ
jgi:hypothetical protein